MKNSSFKPTTDVLSDPDARLQAAAELFARVAVRMAAKTTGGKDGNPVTSEEATTSTTEIAPDVGNDALDPAIIVNPDSMELQAEVSSSDGSESAAAGPGADYSGFLRVSKDGGESCEIGS